LEYDPGKHKKVAKKSILGVARHHGCFCALRDQLSLKLLNDFKDMEHPFTRGCGGIDFPLETDAVDGPALADHDDLDGLRRDRPR